MIGSILTTGRRASRGSIDFVSGAASGMKTCRLCWRITLTFLILIGALHALFLDLSTDAYRAEQLGVVEREALVVARTIARAADAIPDKDFGDLGSLLRDNSVLVGMETFSETGRPVSRFGETVIVLPDTDSRENLTRRIVHDDLQRMEVVWPPERLRAPYFATALIDIGVVDGLVAAYRNQMIGRMILLAVASTLLAMIALEVLILRPVRALRDGLDSAIEAPERAASIRLDTVGSDELAEIASGFHALTGHVPDRPHRAGPDRRNRAGAMGPRATPASSP